MIYTLKHYKRYKRNILRFLESINLKLEYSDTDGEGCYIPSRNKIRIDPNLDEPEEIATLLHEIGHAIDFMFERHRYTSTLETAYENVYRSKNTKKQLKLAVKCERIAWKNGEALAKVLGIKIGKWFFDTKKYCINNYIKS